MFDRLGKTLEKRQGGWLSPSPLYVRGLTFRPPFPRKLFFAFFRSKDGIFIARHLRHLFVTVKKTFTTVHSQSSHLELLSKRLSSMISEEAMMTEMGFIHLIPGADLGGGCRGCAPPPPEMTCGFLIRLVFCKKKQCGLLVSVEVEQETSAPPPKKILDSPLHTEVMFVYPLRGALAKKIRAHDSEMAQYVLKIAHLAISTELTRSQVAVFYPDYGSCEYTLNASQGRRCIMHDITVFKTLSFRLSTRKRQTGVTKTKKLDY